MNATDVASPVEVERRYTAIENAQFAIQTFVIFFVTISQSIFTFIIVRQKRLLLKPTNILLVNLAVANILMGIIHVLYLPTLRTYRWHYGTAACRIITWLSTITYYSTIHGMVSVNINHLIFMIRPLQYKDIMTRVKTILLLVIPWVTSLVVAIPLLHHFKVGESRDNGTLCQMGADRNHDVYHVLSRVFGNFLPWIAQIFMNVAMVAYAIYRSSRDDTMPQEMRRSLFRCSIALALANSAYYLMGSPFMIYVLAERHFSQATYHTLFFMYLAHTLVYPHVWLIHDDLRMAYQRFFCRFCNKDSSPPADDQTTVSMESMDNNTNKPV